MDLVGQGVLQGGELGGLITLRDRTLVEAQDQLDEIAAGLAQAFSTIKQPGTPAVVGDAAGFDIDLANVQPGNDVLFTYSQSGVDKRVRIINTTEPLDYLDASGQRVIGADLSGDVSAAASGISGKLGLAVTKEGAGNVLRIFDDGINNTISIKTAEARTTSTGLQGAGLGFNLFADQGNSAFTNNLNGNPPQKQGFAARISVNTGIIADNQLLVQHSVGGTLGDADRPAYVIAQMDAMEFVSGGNPAASSGKFQLSGKLSEIVSQVISFQGASINAANTKRDDRQLTLDTISDQMDQEYGVNVDEEMARLMELQNAYAANARIVSVVKELLDALFAAV